MELLHIILFLGMTIAGALSQSRACQKDFKLIHDKWCVYVGTQDTSLLWEEARQKCTTLGADLVKMDECGKLAAISYYIDQSTSDEGKGYDFWVGGKRTGTKPRGAWRWVKDDTEISLWSHTWAPNNPDRQATGVYYAAISPSLYQRRYLYDFEADKRHHGYICEN